MKRTKLEAYQDLILNTRAWIRDLAEDRTLPMDKRVYDILWNTIQSIDHDLREIELIKDDK